MHGKQESKGARRDAEREGSDPMIATTLARGLRLLSAFRAQDEEPLGNKQLSERTGLPASTVSRLTYTLVQLGYLSQHPRTGGYSLAAGVLAPAYSFLSRLDIRRVARPFMRRIAVNPGVTVSLATRHELRMTAIESMVAESMTPVVGLFGGRAPIARTAIGHAFIAGLAEPERAALMGELRAYHGDEFATIEKRILRDIAHVARRGYCIVRGEWNATMSAVACPIVVADGGLVLAMSAGGPSQLLTAPTLEALGRALCQIRTEIERAVGRPASANA